MDGEGTAPWRVLIVEDHAALGDALRLAVDLDTGLSCVGVTATVAGALTMVAEQAPDVVLMDVRLPDGDGIEAAGRVKDLRPETAVIVLTAGADAGAPLRAAQAGGSGFLAKDTRMAGILDAVRRAAAGEPAVAPSALQGLLAAARNQGAPEPRVAGRELSAGERDLLVLLAGGERLAAVAARLGLTEDAGRERLAAATAALRARSPLEALVIAAGRGLLDPGRTD